MKTAFESVLAPQCTCDAQLLDIRPTSTAVLIEGRHQDFEVRSCKKTMSRRILVLFDALMCEILQYVRPYFPMIAHVAHIVQGSACPLSHTPAPITRGTWHSPTWRAGVAFHYAERQQQQQEAHLKVSS
jgi:hypothetical protein